METLKGLAARMNKLADDIEEDVSDDAVSVALTIVGSLAFDTPVDVSTALSGWQIGLGSPVPIRRPAFFPGEKGTTFKASAQATVADAREALLAKTPGQPIYISNLEPYIRRLNAGYSKQSPGAFIELAVMRGREHLRAKRGGRP
jgi:hypothetical protein